MRIPNYLKVAVIAVLGVAAAVGIGIAANSISGDSVGLSAKPLSAGETLAPSAQEQSRKRQRERAARRRAQRAKTQTTTQTQTQTTSPTVAPPSGATTEDHSGSSKSGDDHSGKGGGEHHSGKGRGGGDD